MDEPKVNSDYLDIVSSALCFNEWWMVAQCKIKKFLTQKF